MGFKVTGECKVYNLQQKQKSVKAGLGISAKDDQGNWKTEFIQGMFVKDAFEPATRLTPKDKISVISASLNIKTYENEGKKTTYYSLAIFEFENLTNPDANGESDFQPADDDDEELPF